MVTSGQRRIIITILLTVFFLLSLYSSAGFTYAMWLSEADVGSVVTLGRVECTIVEEYENGIIVMPGDTVKKVVTVRNDGNVDELIRVKFDICTSSGRDIPSDAVKIEINETYWKYDSENGWYYYTEILPSGELTVPIFEKYTLDGASVHSDMSGETVSINVVADAVQADCFYDSVPGWDTTAITYSALLSSEPNEVAFISPSYGFSFDYEGETFLNAFSRLVPGEERSSDMTVKNTWDSGVTLSVMPEMPDQTEIPLSFLKDYVTLTINDGENTVYTGPFDVGRYIEIGDLSSMETNTYTVTVSVSPEAGNEYADVISDVQWNFYASGNGDSNPQTGDKSLTVYGILLCIGLIGTVLSCFMLRRERKMYD